MTATPTWKKAGSGRYELTDANGNRWTAFHWKKYDCWALSLDGKEVRDFHSLTRIKEFVAQQLGG
jgi:hypothetical protein